MFCGIIWDFFRNVIKNYNVKVISFCFIFLIELRLQTITSLILLSVNFGLSEKTSYD